MTDRAAALPRQGAAPPPEDWQRRFWLWRRYWLRDPLLGGLDYAVHYGCRHLAIDRVSAFGGWLGVMNGRHRYRRLRERAEGFYRRLSPRSVSPDEAGDAVRRAFDNAGRVMIEFSLIDRLWSAGRIEVAGVEHLRAPRAAGKPLIVMGVHVGNWEVIAPSLTGLGIGPFKFIYQPPRNRFEHRLAVAARRRCGPTLLPAGLPAARAARHVLVEERGVLLIFADDERKGCVNAPLFGRDLNPRSNLVVIARLAAASGATVVPAAAVRVGGARFQLTFLPGIDLGGRGDAAVAENAMRLNEVITPLVQYHLDQWYMLFEHRGDLAPAAPRRDRQAPDQARPH